MATKKSTKKSASTQVNNFSISTYTTKRGDKAPQIIGFSGEDDPRWKAHKASGAKWASASFRRDINGERVYLLMFGTKYMAVAQQLCDALNSGDAKQIEQAKAACQAIYEQNVADGKAAWDAKKAEWKAKAEERKAQKSEVRGKTEEGSQPSEKTYTQSELAGWLRKLNEGTDKEKAAAAKFFNDLAKAA